MVVPSWAVTTVLITVLAPSASAIGPEAVPEATAVPFTVTVDVLTAVVGVTVIVATVLATLSVYAVVVDEKTGDKVPVPGLRSDRLSLVDGAFVTVSVYVFVVVPFCAVTIVVIVLGPTTNGRLCETLPDVTAVPLTVMVALGSAAVGVTVIEARPLPTLAV